MWAQYTPLQRLGFCSIGGMLLLAMGYIGHLQLGSRPELVLNTTSGKPTASEQMSSNEVLVHVIGAVKNPGLVRLQPNARVMDAIEKAGGATSDAQLDLINLAAKVEDGVQLEVPGKSARLNPRPLTTRSSTPRRFPRELPGSIDSGSVPSLGVRPIEVDPPSSSESGPVASGLVSLNTASKAELDTLPGVGPSTADKIIQYREEHGGFTSVDELLAVKGIGPKKLAAIRDRVQL
ncbi:MAG: helix-hairpin-helix domain-containing protein [Fimbriimonas sp.]